MMNASVQHELFVRLFPSLLLPLHFLQESVAHGSSCLALLCCGSCSSLGGRVGDLRGWDAVQQCHGVVLASDDWLDSSNQSLVVRDGQSHWRCSGHRHSVFLHECERNKCRALPGEGHTSTVFGHPLRSGLSQELGAKSSDGKMAIQLRCCLVEYLWRRAYSGQSCQL